MIKKLLYVFSALIIIGGIIISPALAHFRNEMRKEMKLRIQKNQYSAKDLTAFTKEDLIQARWIDQKEFVLNAALYDVVNVETTGGVTVYYCIRDHKETKVKEYQTHIASFFKSGKTCEYHHVPKFFAKTKSKIFIIDTINFEILMQKKCQILFNNSCFFPFDYTYKIFVPPRSYC